MKRSRKNVVRAAAVAVGTASVLAAAAYAAGNAVFGYVVKRREYKGDWSETEYRRRAKAWAEWWDQQKRLPRELVSEDGLNLRGELLLADKATDTVAVVIHGHECTAGGMGFISEFYHRVMGFDVFAPDLRAHGDSEGRVIGMGGLDSRDVVGWIKQLVAERGADIKILLHGISMGSATAMMTCGREDLPDNVKCAVCDCGYSDLRGEITYEGKKMFRFAPMKLLTALADVAFRLRGKYSIASVSPLRAVSRTKVPILFIHGAADALVPTEMAYELYAAHPGEAGKDKQLLIVPGAEHAASFFKDNELYEKTTSEFVKKHL